jgi:hypothetical protein
MCYLDVAYFSHTCYECFIFMLHIFYMYIATVYFKCFFVSEYVASKCFILQVFHGGTVGDGCTAWSSRDGVRRARGWLLGSAHVERERG